MTSADTKASKASSRPFVSSLIAASVGLIGFSPAKAYQQPQTANSYADS